MKGCSDYIHIVERPRLLFNLVLIIETFRLHTKKQFSGTYNYPPFCDVNFLLGLLNTFWLCYPILDSHSDRNGRNGLPDGVRLRAEKKRRLLGSKKG